MTSGDMYMGVPVIDFCLPGRRVVGSARTLWSGWRVLFWRAMTLAAPKSTYLMTPLWSRRMSLVVLVAVLRDGGIRELTLGLDVAMADAALVKVC